MQFHASEMVVKISVSDVPKSIAFYERVLGFIIDERYTLNTGGDFGEFSYVQMYFPVTDDNRLILGLFKDIDKPFEPLPQTGIVPSFIVKDVNETLQYFQDLHVVIDKIDGHIIQSNTSDDGYTDHFFFFRDPDNNSLVVRENMPRQ